MTRLPKRWGSLLLAGSLLGGEAAHGQWSTAALLNEAGESSSDVKCGKIRGSRHGGFHASYITNAGQMRYRRWKGSLSSAVTVANDLIFNSHMDESPNGDVHIVWENWAGGTPEVGWARSTDNGASFSSPVELTSTSGQAKWPLVAGYGVGQSGQAVMSYWNASNKDVRARHFSGTWGSDTYLGSDGNSEYEVYGIARSPLDGTVFRSYDAGAWLGFRQFDGTWSSFVNVDDWGFSPRIQIAVNDAGQVMMLWDNNEKLYSAVYTPGSGVGSRQLVTEDSTWGTSLCNIAGTNDFYTAYCDNSNGRVYGIRWSNGSWGSIEQISSGLSDYQFIVGPDVSSDPSGSGKIYCVWEYWGSGRPQQYYSIRSIPRVSQVKYDISKDGKSDLAVVETGSTWTWNIRKSESNFANASQYDWGTDGDIPLMGDVEGDGRADIIVYRPAATSVWWILKSSSNFTTYYSIEWGSSSYNDVPFICDYDNDGISDLGIYRPGSPSNFYIKTSSTAHGSHVGINFGASGDVPLTGDWDGDNKLDIAVYRPDSTASQFRILTSSSNYATTLVYNWGTSSLGDIPVVGDYDKDGKSDVVVYRPGATAYFWVLKSSTNFTGNVSYQWGTTGDLPVSGDYDGDGYTDLVVYRDGSPSTWWIKTSGSNFGSYVQYNHGSSGNIVAGDAGQDPSH